MEMPVNPEWELAREKFVAEQWWRRAWTIPPRDLRKRDWAEKYFKISKGERQGEFKLSTNPIMGPILDVLDHPDIREFYLMKAVQTGGSTVVRIDMAHVAHTDPCFAMLVLPSQAMGRTQIKKYWKPALSGKDCPVLAQYQRRRPARRGAARRGREVQEDTDRTTYENIVLSNGFDLILGYAGSAASLASHPCKRVTFDEIDKFIGWTEGGGEASPIDLGRQRMMTYEGVQKMVALSTPTNEDGEIAKLFEAADIRLYPFCACRECKQPIQQMFENIIYELPDHKAIPDPLARAAYLRRHPALCWLECPHCHAKHLEDEQRDMLDGIWLATQDQGWQLHADGRTVGQKPEGTRVGIHYPQMVSKMGMKLVNMTAEWIEAEGSPSKIQNCKNNHHGVPFVFDQVKPARGRLMEKCRADEERGFVPPPANRVPKWASRLVMTVDTQQDKFYWVIRAWGSRMRSRLVAYGEAQTFEQLEYLEGEAVWTNEDPSLPQRRVWITAIDSGGGDMGVEHQGANRTEQVYRWCAASPQTRIPLKGSHKPMDSMTRMKPTKYQSPKTNETTSISLLWINSLASGDELSRMQVTEMNLIDPETGEVQDDRVDQWELNEGVGNDYLRHLQVMTRKSFQKGKGRVYRWVPEADGARHDWFDCERYQTAIAFDPILGCSALPDERHIRRQVNEVAAIVGRGGNGRVSGGFRLGVPARR